MNIKFPMANISYKLWNKELDYIDYVLVDNFIYTNDNVYYEYYLLNQRFVDSKGDIYEVIDRKLPSLIRQTFSFIPNFCKVELVFKQTPDRMTIDEVREHILRQLNQYEKDEHIISWINTVKNSNDFEEIINT